MRSAMLLLGGLGLLAAGIALIALEVPGRWIAGPLLVVAGIALKLVAVLRDPQPAAATGRTKTTLGTAPAPSAASGAAPASVRAVTSATARRRGQTGQVS